MNITNGITITTSQLVDLNFTSFLQMRPNDISSESCIEEMYLSELIILQKKHEKNKFKV